MNTKNAKKVFSFNVFLASIAGQPLEIKYIKIAEALNISESTLSKLRHGRMQKLPASLHPSLMAAQFAAEIVKCFEPTRSTVRQFSTYAQGLNEKYIFSDSLVRFAALFNVGGTMVEEERIKKFYSGMIPELIQRCYEEAYSTTEQDYANWMLTHSDAQSEAVYQKMCDTINEEVLDSDKLKQLLNVVYAASFRREHSQYFSDISFLEILGEFIHSQVNQPFYNSVRRSELISISENSRQMHRVVQAEEQIVAQSLNPMEFTLTQCFYHAMGLPVKEIAEHAFKDLSCTVNNQPLVKYINTHENTGYTSPLQFITVTETSDCLGAAATTQLVLRFRLYPSEPGEPIQVAYQYSSTSPFIQNISCNYSYTLHYPCKSLEHEFLLDEKTQQKWGVRVKLFAPLTNSSCDVKNEDDNSLKGATAGSKWIKFFNWAMPGSGYYRNLYELNPDQSLYSKH